MILNTHIDGKGYPLVFLHGLFGSWENWGSQMRRLSDQFRVIGVDLRNHGRSAHADDMNYTVMADDVEQTLRDLDIQHYHLLGHSMGGKIAMELACRPEISGNTGSATPAGGQLTRAVSRLVIVDIAPRLYEPHHSAILQSLNALDTTALRSRQQANDQMRAEIHEDAVRMFLLKNLARLDDGTFGWKMNLESITREYTKLLQSPACKQPFPGPTIVIRGALSDYVRSTDHTLFNRWFRQLNVQSIDGAGHWPQATHPDRVNELLVDFLI